MDVTCKRIAVIGAGPVGLTTIKNLLERGHNVTGYEKQSSIGGLWNYQECNGDEEYAALSIDPLVYTSGCYYSLIQNTSKIMSQFSDFPAADSLPEVLKHYQYLKYLQDYAKHFSLYDQIKFNCTITNLCLTPESAASARHVRQWEVHYVYKGANGHEQNGMEIYDLVVVASGKFSCPKVPIYSGMESFKKPVMHSVQIRRDNVFQNKRVLIAGGGFSGAEMVCNALNVYAQIYWAVTGTAKSEVDHNHWAYSRLKESNGKPWDHSIGRCGHPQKVFGDNGELSSWLYPLIQSKMHPSLRFPGDGFAITDVPRIKDAILSGQVCIISPIDHFTDSSIILSDGTTLGDIDLVVFCTGYTVGFPFLDRLWEKTKQVEATFYRHMLPTEEQLQGIAFIGLTSSLPSLFPIAEMQSRWLAEDWASRTPTTDGRLYSEKELSKFKAEIKKRKDSLLHREKFSFLSDSFAYMDELAAELGCHPLVNKQLETDHELVTALMHAPLVSAQYRLVGKNAWPDARNYIIKMAKEVLIKDENASI